MLYGTIFGPADSLICSLIRPKLFVISCRVGRLASFFVYTETSVLRNALVNSSKTDTVLGYVLLGIDYFSSVKSLLSQRP